MKKSIGKYLLFTFLISWGAWGILVLLSTLEVMKYGQAPFMIIFIIGGIGPLISAIITRKTSGDVEGFKQFKKQIFKFKFNLLWYLWIIFIPLLMSGIPWIISSITNGITDPLFKQPIYMALAMLPAMIIGGGLEEVGWRGVMLPDLRKSKSNFVSTIILGAVWSVWHLPLWFIKGTAQEGINFVFFAITVICITFLLTILYTRTNSILACILFHSFFNSYASCVNSPSVNPIIDISAKLLFCLIVFFIFEKVKFSENKLKTESV